MAFTDATRSLNIATSLGKDSIQLIQMRGEEELSRLFHFELGLISSNAKIAAEDIIGSNVTFSIDYDDGKQRYFNGFVERFAAGDEDACHSVQDGGLALQVAELLQKLKGLLIEGHGCVEVAASDEDIRHSV